MGANDIGRDEFLVMPGEFYVGQGRHTVRTLLGSCVALVFWHPLAEVGGMCHYLLPGRTRSQGMPRDGQYADEALEMVAEMMARAGAPLSACQAWFFGGANSLASQPVPSVFDIAQRNVEAGLAALGRSGARLVSQDVGGRWPRNVSLHLSSGQVTCRSQQPTTANPP
jgi:chemotaxis protein CheD